MKSKDYYWVTCPKLIGKDKRRCSRKIFRWTPTGIEIAQGREGHAPDG